MSQLEKNLYKRVVVKPNIKKSVDGRTYRGFSTTANNPKNFGLYDYDLIRQDLINHFHIRQTEKLSDPTFGTIIWDILFEPFTREVQEAVVKDVTRIVNYDPRTKIDKILVDTFDQGIQVDITLTFLPYKIQDQLRFKFDKENGLLS